jgi:hypothetical protein
MIPIMQVVSPALRGRLAFLGPVRGLQKLAPGVMDAPWGCATVVSLHLQGTASMQGWNSNTAAMSMQLLQDTASYHLRKYQAYMVRTCAEGVVPSVIPACLCMQQQPGYPAYANLACYLRMYMV